MIYRQTVTGDERNGITITVTATEEPKGSFPRTGEFYGGSFGLTGPFNADAAPKAMRGRLQVTLTEQRTYKNGASSFRIV